MAGFHWTVNRALLVEMPSFTKSVMVVDPD